VAALATGGRTAVLSCRRKRKKRHGDAIGRRKKKRQSRYRSHVRLAQ
jgi:hypothetical protein